MFLRHRGIHGKIFRGGYLPIFWGKGADNPSPLTYFILLWSDFTVRDLRSKSEKSRPTDFKIDAQKGGQICSQDIGAYMVKISGVVVYPFLKEPRANKKARVH